MSGQAGASAPKNKTLAPLVFGLIFLIIGVAVLPRAPHAGASWGFLAVLAGYLLFFIAIGAGVAGSYLGILVDGQNSFSLSRLQMVAWTWVVLSGLTALAGARLHQTDSAVMALNIFVPANLFVAMGISYFSGVAAPALLSLKQSGSDASAGATQAAADRSNETVIASGQVAVRPQGAKPKWSDLVQGDDIATVGLIDVSKVQQLLISGILIGMYLLMLWETFLGKSILGVSDDVWSLIATQYGIECAKSSCALDWSALPDFSSSMLVLLGISHAGYLAYKVTPRTGSPSNSTPNQAGPTQPAPAPGPVPPAPPIAPPVPSQ